MDLCSCLVDVKLQTMNRVHTDTHTHSVSLSFCVSLCCVMRSGLWFEGEEEATCDLMDIVNNKLSVSLVGGQWSH